MKVSSIRAALLCVAAISALPALAAEDCPRADALGTSRTIEVDPAGGLKLGLKSYPRSLALEKGEVVLTFDDGPLPATTGPVLKALKDECVKATFFLVGRNAAANPVFVKRELMEGHTVGHHTFSHPFVTMRGLTDAAARADIDKGFAADDKAAYGAATSEPRVPFFRFPGFADTTELDSWLATRGVAVFGADLWASDWVEMTPEKTMDLLLTRLEAVGKGIVLLHDTRPQTAQMLPRLLRELKVRGYRIVHIVPGKGPTPLAEVDPATFTSETEAAIAKVWPKILAEKRHAAANPSRPAPSSAASH